MKISVGILSLAVSFNVLAFPVTTMTKSFVYDGTQSSSELVLSAEVSHEDYIYRDVESTCVRRENRGQVTECHSTHYPGTYYPSPYYRGPYHPGPVYPGPRGPYGDQCISRPIYRDVTYPCVQSVRVSNGIVKDFDVQARAIVDVTNRSVDTSSNVTLDVTLSGEQLFLSARPSDKFFVVKKKEDVRATVHGSLKNIDALYALELIDSASILSALNIKNIEVDKNLLKMKVGAISNADDFKFSLKIVQNKFLSSDKTVVDRTLDASEIMIISSADESEITVDLAKLGTKIEDGKFSITPKIAAKFNGSVLNSTTDLSASKTLIYKAH